MIIVNNVPINETAMNILLDVQSQLTNGKLKDIIDGGEDIRVTCPFHSDGHEKTASCFIRKDDFVFHCFGCGEKGGIGKFIAACFGILYKSAEEWIINKYGSDVSSEVISLEPIVLNTVEYDNDLIDESILSTLESYHPYMKQRKISDEIISKYELKYDPKDQSIVFPVRNELGQLVGLTRRNVNYKRFELWKFKNKPVYLLYDILRNNIKTVYITESQINTLTLESWGYDSVALMGTGTKYQYDLLNKSGVRHFIIALDPDYPGLNGTKKLCENLRSDIFVSVVLYNDLRDINDLTKEEFESLKVVDRSEFLKNNIK